MAERDPFDEDLPDELRDEFEGEQQATADQILALNEMMVRKREEAVAIRKNSGIEDTWMTCEEAYVGIDDMNRAEFANAKWAKPTSMAGPVTTEYTKADKTRSSVYVRLTSRYVDMATSKLCDGLFPMDDKPFSIEPLPNPELVKAADDKSLTVDDSGRLIYRDLTPEEVANNAMKAETALRATAAQGGNYPAGGVFNPLQPVAAPAPAPGAAQPGQPPQAGAQPPAQAGQPAQPTLSQVPMTVGDFAKMKLEAAEDAADKAETRMQGWLVEANYAIEGRKVVFDAARIGVGVLKGPIPKSVKAQAVTVEDQGGKTIMALQMIEKIVPGVKWIDPWNFFPASDCGEDVRDGDGIFERDYITEKTLRGLKKLKGKGYLADVIDEIIEQGPLVTPRDEKNPNQENRSKTAYAIWYYVGTLSRQEVEVLNENEANKADKNKQQLDVIVEMVNDRIIRAVLNPLDSGHLPYCVFPWSRRPGNWAGVGVAEQVAGPQRIVNAGTRALLNNAGQSAGVQYVVDRASIVPADGQWVLTPNKIWYTTGETPIVDVRQAINVLEIPNIGEPLMELIKYGQQLAEEQSNIPLVSQGQLPANMPDTFGAAQLLNTNANSLLRNLALAYDAHVMFHLVHGLYEWLMLDPDVPNEEKGDFLINAHGSVALIERAIQEQVYTTLLTLSTNPAYRIDPVRAAEEWMRARRVDPRKVQYSEQEQAKMDAQPPQPPVQVQVAQIRAQAQQAGQTAKAQSDAQLLQSKYQAELQQMQQEDALESQRMANGQVTPHGAAAEARIQTARIKAESDAQIQASRAEAEQAYAATEAQMARDNAQAQLEMLQIKREIAMLQYATQQKISLDQIKADLAKTAMMENTKRQLAATDLQAASTENALDRGHDAAKHLANLQQDARQAAPPGAPTGAEGADV